MEDEPQRSQLWHRDPEDLKIIKIFIYLADEDRGPFCYIPETRPLSAGAGRVPKHAEKKTVSDDEMRG